MEVDVPTLPRGYDGEPFHRSTAPSDRQPRRIAFETLAVDGDGAVEGGLVLVGGGLSADCRAHKWSNPP